MHLQWIVLYSGKWYKGYIKPDDYDHYTLAKLHPDVYNLIIL